MNTVIFIIEILGTIAFAISGVIVGKEKNMDLFGVCMLGITTGYGGGVLRDIFAGDIPYIFRKHIYASASIVGSLLCALLIPDLGSTAAMIIGLVVIMLIRFAAAYYKLNLPKMHN